MKENQDFNKRLSDVIKKGRDFSRDNLDTARVLPQARDLEEAVLGAIMLEAGALDKVVEILRVESFYVDAHSRIFRAMKSLYEENEPVDILTVNEKLKASGDLEMVGGSYFIASLTNKVSSSANIEFHARIIAQKYLQRELISVSSNTLKDAYDDTIDVFDLLDRAEANLFELTETNMKKNTERVGSVLLQELEEIDQRRLRAVEGDVLTGVGSGFVELDRLTAGWQKSDLIILAARPGMGKTAFTLALARNASVDLDKPVAVFSLEMSSNQLVSRLISMETEIDSDKLRKGTLLEREWKHLTKNIDNLQKAPLFVDDTPAIGIFELRAKCRRLKAKHDIQMIIIDYLQLMTGSSDGKGGGNREQEISQISRALKGIAKELGVPIIALSQLSRAVETRGGAKRPMLSDLRESGAIEQDADMVIFLYRPEYYNITEDEDGQDCRGIAEVIIAKNRHGALKTIKIRFVANFAKFVDLDAQFMELPKDYDMGNTITKSSRMNQNDQDFNTPSDFDDITPF
ncbi:MAG: replicative DNA helicase [Chitinophagales bacterium]|nr:replicative DNA helicase [Bacteroidota bacterium]MCB9256983.1 replicative DNA helicase [Chitinophagales bacterium]